MIFPDLWNMPHRLGGRNSTTCSPGNWGHNWFWECSVASQLGAVKQRVKWGTKRAAVRRAGR